MALSAETCMMPIYTFYPCRADGSAATFEAFELEGDSDAMERADELLKQHPSSAFVTIWQGDRKVRAQAGEEPLRIAREPQARSSPHGR